MLLHQYGSGICYCRCFSTAVALVTASVRQWHLSLPLLQCGSGTCYCISTAVALVTCYCISTAVVLVTASVRQGGAQVHLKETRKGLPRIIWENLHLAFERMDDARYQFSADDKAYVADSPFMQLMVALSVAVPGVKIVVQFSSGVEIHVDYRHLHRTAEMVSPSHPRSHPMLQEASPVHAACTCRFSSSCAAAGRAASFGVRLLGRRLRLCGPGGRRPDGDGHA